MTTQQKYNRMNDWTTRELNNLHMLWVHRDAPAVETRALIGVIDRHPTDKHPLADPMWVATVPGSTQVHAISLSGLEVRGLPPGWENRCKFLTLAQVQEIENNRYASRV